MLWQGIAEAISDLGHRLRQPQANAYWSGSSDKLPRSITSIIEMGPLHVLILKLLHDAGDERLRHTVA